MKSWFQRQGYLEDAINSEVKKVVFPGKFVNLVIKIKLYRLCQPTNHYLKRLIALLENTLKKMFQPGPMESFRSPRNLCSCLVRVKLYPMERKTGYCKCKGNRCQLH